MKRNIICLCAAALTLTLTMPAFAAESGTGGYYPIDVTQSEDGREIRKTYELTPEQDPAGIPQDDFILGDLAFSLTDLLKEEIPQTEERQESQKVTSTSKTGDMDAVLAALPQDKAYSSEDGFTGTLTLQRDSVTVTTNRTTGTKTVTASRSYPNLSSQDTAAIPKTIQENGATLTLTGIQWQTDNSIPVGGVPIGNRFTAVCTYSGTVTTSGVSGYKVTATYAGTVSKVVVSKIRYIAVFTGAALAPTVPPAPGTTQAPAKPTASPDYVVGPSDDDPAPPTFDIVDREDDVTPTTAPTDAPSDDLAGAPTASPTDRPDQTAAPGFTFRWSYVLFPVGLLVAAGIGIGIAVLIKNRAADGDDAGDDDDETEDEEDEDV